MCKYYIISILPFILGFITGCQTKASLPVIAFSRLTGEYWQIWTMQSDGGSACQITNTQSDKRYPVWGENATELIFRDNDGQAFIIDAEIGNEKRILKSFGQISSIAPSPVGKQLLFVRFRTEVLDSSDT